MTFACSSTLRAESMLTSGGEAASAADADPSEEGMCATWPAVRHCGPRRLR